MKYTKENPPSLGTCPGLGQCFHQAHRNFPDGGNILEFGVGGGYSYSWMAWWIENFHKNDTLTGFDGWQGLPAETEGIWIPPEHRKGNYVHHKQYVHDKCKDLGVDIIDHPKFHFVDGMYDETLTPRYQQLWIDALQLLQSPVILVNMDVDLHSSAKLVLDFILPLIRPGTMIYTDDWYFPSYNKTEPDCGVSLAFHEWWEKNPDLKMEQKFECPSSQRYFEILEVPSL